MEDMCYERLRACVYYCSTYYKAAVRKLFAIVQSCPVCVLFQSLKLRCLNWLDLGVTVRDPSESKPENGVTTLETQEGHAIFRPAAAKILSCSRPPYH
jgi:hypothetical protein